MVAKHLFLRVAPSNYDRRIVSSLMLRRFNNYFMNELVGDWRDRWEASQSPFIGRPANWKVGFSDVSDRRTSPGPRANSREQGRAEEISRVSTKAQAVANGAFHATAEVNPELGRRAFRANVDPFGRGREDADDRRVGNAITIVTDDGASLHALRRALGGKLP
jgi:hypothetical protein